MKNKLITARRVAGMAETMELGRVAKVLNISEDQVQDEILRSGRAVGRLVVECCKTGRRFYAGSERGAYRVAMREGLVDWTMERQ